MFYRLTPPATVTWCAPAIPRLGDIVRENPQIDLDQFDWAPAEERTFSDDLLRIAVRTGIATRTGIVVEGTNLVNLGHADTIRSNQISTDQARAALNETGSMKALHRMFPGMAEADAELDERVRKSTEAAARRVEQDLAADLAAAPLPELVEHWRQLGGRYPD